MQLEFLAIEMKSGAQNGERLKYSDYITERKNNWDKSPPKEKALYQTVIG